MHGSLKSRTLVVGRTEARAQPWVDELLAEGVDVVSTSDLDEARRLVVAGAVDVVVLGGGLDDAVRTALADELRAAAPDVPVHLKDRISGPSGVGPFVRALAQGKARPHAWARRLPASEDDDFLELAAFNQGSVGVFRCGPGTSPWEHHPDDDEMLYVLEGAVEITVLTGGGPLTTLVEPGSAFVVPRGLWHKHHVPERLVELYATPGGTVHSDADDPTTPGADAPG